MVNETITLKIVIILLTLSITGCSSIQSETTIPYIRTIAQDVSILPTTSPDLSEYAFPDSIDPTRQYLFYLHGKIVEDQGLPAISTDYGEYEYDAILETLGSYGFVMISEQRSKNTESYAYAKKIVGQITALLNAGVPAKNITVVGASKGAGITIYVSHLLENEEVNFVIMAICTPDVVEEMIVNQIILYGNVLSIYDSTDEFAGSCQSLFAFSEGKGITRYDEIILNVGMGHGILYQPLDIWIIPIVQWCELDT